MHAKKYNIYHKLFTTIKPYLVFLVIAIIGLVCTKLLEAGIYKFLVPKLLVPKGSISSSNLNKLLFYSLFAMLFWGVARFTTKYFVGFATKNLATDLRAYILRHLLIVPISIFNTTASGNLVSKVNYDVEQVSRALSDSILELLNSIIGVLFFIGVMFSCSWRLSLIGLTIAPLIGILLSTVNAKIRKYSDRVQQSIGDISHLTHELIEASQVIRVFDAVATETARIIKLLTYNFKQELKIILVSASSESMMRIIVGTTIIILIYIAHKYIDITTEALIGFCTAMAALIRPAKQLSEVNSVIARGLAAANSVFELLEWPVEHVKQKNNIKFQLSNNFELKFNKVNFNYKQSSALILQNIDLTIKANTITAIVGKSGSGKSTLVTLLPRFYKVTAGEILLNNNNINNINLIELRKQLAMVSQNIVLLNDTVLNNIAYGSMHNATKKEIIQAAEEANAMEFIAKLPHGLDTYIGSNGSLLSGGQRQRIAIARAILKRARILIFDEATSALDPYSEQCIQQVLLTLKTNTMIIIIAHRLSTIENAEQIIILDNGKLVATGSHQELSNNLYYTNLYQTALNEII